MLGHLRSSSKWARAVAVSLASIGVSAASTDCALFGPDFPAPREAATDPSLAEAFATLKNQFDSSVNPQDQAYSVAVFSVHDDSPLWEYHHTPSTPFGVDIVDGDAIYRVGSISKVFTVWTMLISLGDGYLDRSITEFVPELQPFLSFPVPQQGMQYDDIDNIRWEDITLRDLASHAAGIPRDRESIHHRNYAVAELTHLQWARRNCRSKMLPWAGSRSCPKATSSTVTRQIPLDYVQPKVSAVEIFSNPKTD
jgi:CubicO group peptidase (beta-lactamase class C family)